MVNIHPDVSKWQPAVDDSFNRSFLMFRALAEQGGIDAKAPTNLAWCVRQRGPAGKIRAAVAAVKSVLGMRVPVRLINFGVYVIPEFVAPAMLVLGLDALGVPRDCVVMIDWESWSGKLSGDHSVRLNNLADRLRARQGGRPDLVWGYSNRGDLNGWRTRPAWLGMIIAGYNSNDPRDDGIPNVIGWQYADAVENHTSYPSSTPPFGRCDHNVLFIDYPTPIPGSHDVSGRGSTTEDLTIMDADTKTYLDAKFAALATHQDALTILDGTPSRDNSLKDIRNAQDAYYGDPAHPYSQAALATRQAQQMAAQVTDSELAVALSAFLPTVTQAVTDAVAGGSVDPGAVAQQVVTRIGELLKGATS